MPAASPHAFSGGLCVTKSISATRRVRSATPNTLPRFVHRSASNSPTPSSWKGGTKFFAGEMPGIAPLLKRAAERLPLYAFSNTNGAHVEHFSQRYAAVLGHFREIFLSSRIGLRKPDPAAYDHVVKAIGAPAERIVFFDDLAENIEGARARGLTAVHVTSPDDVAEAVAALGI